MYNVKVNFHDKLDPALRLPGRQIQVPTDENFAPYGKLIAGLGGADVCFGSIGWSGHAAYIEYQQRVRYCIAP